ncbi:MAG TPA: hypothetical protein VMU90_03310 [Solirubrobacteraceae bacterium]|nr:hypothetical protein [Solirubrobacteraceae bacterium]
MAGLAALLALGAIGGGVKAGLGSLPSQHGLDGHAAPSQPGGTPRLALHADSPPMPLVAPPARPASAFFTLPGAGPIPAVALTGAAVRGTKLGSPSRPTPTWPYLPAAPLTAPLSALPAPPSNSPAPTATPAPSAPTPQSQPAPSSPSPSTGSSAPADQSAPSDQSTPPSQPAPSDQSQTQSSPSGQSNSNPNQESTPVSSGSHRSGPTRSSSTPTQTTSTQTT